MTKDEEIKKLKERITELNRRTDIFIACGRRYRDTIKNYENELFFLKETIKEYEDDALR